GRTTEFATAPGWRPAGGALCGVIALMLLGFQLQDGPRPEIRLAALLGAAVFGIAAWYMIRRGLRRGLALRIGPEGVGIALGFRGWIEAPWDQVRAWRYWEPTGVGPLVRREPRWIGVRLKDESVLAGRLWDERLEIWLGRTHQRPPLCVVDPFVTASMPEVQEAFRTQAPALDDPEGRIVGSRVDRGGRSGLCGQAYGFSHDHPLRPIPDGVAACRQYPDRRA
ncbi:MAG TPA: hypothetical protein VFJ13_02435, partial [Paracoccaceae bacterium]|nr:hypothetical protein [Paracoccaceae bacterium]